ncbi:MAG: DUF3987 domain-containing protein [Candidatus Hinthialibacter antarcticus]|nr:DUF3987 domain-containing protein [Candidatus Hinthialibacter antarcticus]
MGKMNTNDNFSRMLPIALDYGYGRKNKAPAATGAKVRFIMPSNEHMFSINQSSNGIKRFSNATPCPICGGHQGLSRESGSRCGGYYMPDENAVVCTKVESEKRIDSAGGWRHKLNGQNTRIEMPKPNSSGNGKRSINATYDYKDERGKLLFQVVRYEPKDFRQRRHNGSGGWLWNLNGVKRVLYRLTELLEAPKGETIHIVEGERDVHALVDHDLYATCNPGGAGKWHLIDADSLKVFESRQVVILPDNDKPGIDHAQQVAMSLYGKAASVKIVRLPGLPPKGDVSDWLDSGGAIDELHRLVDEAPEWEPMETVEVIEFQPLPLQRETEPSQPFPIDQMPEELASAINAIYQATQAPLALCATSVIASVTLAAQAIADIQNDGRTTPTSNFFVAVGDTGERKSAVDELTLNPVREFEREKLTAYQDDISKYVVELELFEKAKSEAIGAKKTSLAEKRQALNDLEAPPDKPKPPHILLEEPTYEGLIIHFANGCESAGIFSDEGGRFIHGHAMNPDNRIKTSAGLSALWNGRDINRARAGDGIITLQHKRLSMSLMLQPRIALALFADDEVKSQGLLSRCLITFPESTCGTRTYREFNPLNDASYRRYCETIRSLLIKGETIEPSQRQALKLDVSAKKPWIEYYNMIEVELAPDGELSELRAFANKAPEHALRLAGAIAVYQGVAEINRDAMLTGIQLASYFLNEASRLNGANVIDEKITLAKRLLEWLKQHSRKAFYLSEVYQSGPRPIRDKQTALAAIKVLEDHRYISKVREGLKIDGAVRQNAWEVMQC